MTCNGCVAKPAETPYRSCRLSADVPPYLCRNPLTLERVLRTGTTYGSEPLPSAKHSARLTDVVVVVSVIAQERNLAVFHVHARRPDLFQPNVLQAQGRDIRPPLQPLVGATHGCVIRGDGRVQYGQFPSHRDYGRRRAFITLHRKNRIMRADNGTRA